MKEETLKHKEALEYYYSLGDKRSYVKVGRKLGISETSISKWGKSFNWQDRIIQRDIEVARGMESRTNKAVLNTRGDFRAEIKAQFSLLKKLLNNLIRKFEDKQVIEIDDIAGLKDVIGCYERLVKLDLTLMGEASEIAESTHTFEEGTAKETLRERVEKAVDRQDIEMAGWSEEKWLEFIKEKKAKKEEKEREDKE